MRGRPDEAAVARPPLNTAPMAARGRPSRCRAPAENVWAMVNRSPRLGGLTGFGIGH